MKRVRLECPFNVMGIGAIDVVAPCGKLAKTMELGAVERRTGGRPDRSSATCAGPPSADPR
jgi:hypothetical protein